MKSFVLEIEATGDSGEELSTTVECEAENKDEVVTQYEQSTEHVEYWDLNVVRVQEKG